MTRNGLPEDFYDRIEAQLRRRIGRELRLARRVLDFGCGSCELVRYLAETYQQRVTGVDILSTSFPKRVRSSVRKRIQCIQKDAAHLDFAADRSMDAVVMKWALHEMEQPDSVLREAVRILRPGGELLIVDFPRDSLAQELWDENYYSPDEVKERLLEAGFHEVRVRLIAQKQVIWARGFRPADGKA